MFEESEIFALRLDREDSLASFRESFHIPKAPEIYFAGNSLGLQPKGVRVKLEAELERWKEIGVKGHHSGEDPWFSYHEALSLPMSEIVGAKPEEVVMMNALTVNLHLMMISFYQPKPGREKILIAEKAFPSDHYAVESQIRFHGLDPEKVLVEAQPEEIESTLEKEGERIALVLLEGVSYFTGRALNIQAITRTAKERGCMVGCDLAHAAGNILLDLHDWGVDFAVWCSYKYLNSGPGAAGGCFVHEKHARDFDRPRLAGWWGNNPATRFRMESRFAPHQGAAGWQVSNPPIFSMLPCRVSLDLFHQAGMRALRQKSEKLTGFLEFLLDRIPEQSFTLITPRPVEERGCQLSMRVLHRPEAVFQSLQAKDITCDFREPDVIRVAPTPFYNTYHEAWRFARIFSEILSTVK